jgi:hypothetical protein
VSGCAMADEASARVGRQEDPACPHFCLLRALWLKRGAEGGGMPRVPSSVPLCLCIPPCRIEKKVDLRRLLSQAGGGRRRARSKGRGVSVVGSPGAPEGSLGRYHFRLEEEEEGGRESVWGGAVDRVDSTCEFGSCKRVSEKSCRGAVNRERGRRPHTIGGAQG